MNKNLESGAAMTARADQSVMPDPTQRPECDPYSAGRERGAAVPRYRCEPTGRGFWPYCVRAGDGTRELLTGHRKQMERAAAALNEAYADGVFVGSGGMR